ncbi:MAG: hypothetical protein QNJ22_12260 [Desulfosarcinaceae bacterium]|nr:hypothetical protein [Desulfosarcinaceae bacterium]
MAIHLSINLAKWKRWSREFLPPDPLGGLRSGYARQYSLKEAFLVALGGFLVGDLKFTVVEARAILTDLQPWLSRWGYLRLSANGASRKGDGGVDPHALIFVRPAGAGGAGYLYWRDSLISGAEGEGVGNTLPKAEFFNFPAVRMINIGSFAKAFYHRIT